MFFIENFPCIKGCQHVCAFSTKWKVDKKRKDLVCYKWRVTIFLVKCLYDRYNRLFRFLLAVKRAQIDIQHCWTLQMQYKQKPSNQEEVAKWQLRTHMAFLVDNLQYYLQVRIFLVFVTSAHHEIFLNFFSTKNSKMKLKRLPSLFLAHLHLSFIGMPSFKSQNILFYKKHLPMPCYFLGSCRTLLV